jgi:hypothetical protein
MSPVLVTNFYPNYLTKNQPGTVKTPRAMTDVLFCPTDQWHRLNEDESGTDAVLGDPQLIGYFYLPGRIDKNTKTDGWSYGEPWPELVGWATRQKFGGPDQLAPIMSDRLQGQGSWSASANKGSGILWTDSDAGLTVASANHPIAARGDMPAGGNFLFEDGHVRWYRFDVNDARDTVDIGCSEGNWNCFYKLPDVPITQ